MYLFDRLYDLLFGRAQKKSPEDMVVAHLRTLRGAIRADLSGLLAAALFAKKTLDSTRQVDAPFPDAIVLGEAPLDAAACAILSAYALDLEKFQVICLERETPLSLAVGKGLTTWIATFHSMANPHLAPLGQEIWSRLVTGEAGLEEAHQFLLRRKASDVERTYFSYRPTVLLTDEE